MLWLILSLILFCVVGDINSILDWNFVELFILIDYCLFYGEMEYLGMFCDLS